MKNKYHEECGKLWGGTIYNIEMDLYIQNFSIYIRAGKKMAQFYKLNFKSTSLFSFKNNRIPCTWNYAELTEIYIEKKGDVYVAEIILWDERCVLEINCQDICLSLIGMLEK